MIKRYKIKGWASTYSNGYRMVRHLPEVEGVEITSIRYNDWLAIKFIFQGTEEETRKIIVYLNKMFDFYPKSVKEKRNIFKFFNRDRDFTNEL